MLPIVILATRCNNSIWHLWPVHGQAWRAAWCRILNDTKQLTLYWHGHHVRNLPTSRSDMIHAPMTRQARPEVRSWWNVCSQRCEGSGSIHEDWRCYIWNICNILHIIYDVLFYQFLWDDDAGLHRLAGPKKAAYTICVCMYIYILNYEYYNIRYYIYNYICYMYINILIMFSETTTGITRKKPFTRPCTCTV